MKLIGFGVEAKGTPRFRQRHGRAPT
jgi:hypothetical protein